MGKGEGKGRERGERRKMGKGGREDGEAEEGKGWARERGKERGRKKRKKMGGRNKRMVALLRKLYQLTASSWNIISISRTTNLRTVLSD